MALKPQDPQPVKERPSPLAELLNVSPAVHIPPSPTPSPPFVTLPEPPISQILPGGTHVFQTFNNCGPAALSMALSYYGHQVSQQTLGNQIRPYQNSQGDNDDKSVTLAELAARAEEFGLRTYHRPAGDMELIEQFIAQGIPVIARTWLRPGEDIGHYRVVKGYDRARRILIQDDSLQGRNLEYTYDAFNELWHAFNYEFLVLVPTDKIAIAEQILGERLNETAAWELALELAQNQEQAEPNNPYARFNQLVAHYYLDEYQQAVDIYEDVADELPRRMLWYQIEPILAYYHLGEYDIVLNMSQDIFNSQNRAFSELHWLRGMIFQQRGDETAAAQAFALSQQYNSSPYWEVNVE